jgi:hypothetical protein
MRYAIALFSSAALLAAHAQVACDVVTPGGLQGSYAHTWAEPGPGSWDTPNLLIPGMRVEGPLVRAFSLGEADSLGCGPLANAAEVAGKVAVLYRGTCDYALKAKYCQDAGAVGVVIINNEEGAPQEMGAGPIGPQVHIPVFQISLVDGTAWMEALGQGTALSVLLGNKDGYYAHDAGIRKKGVVMPPSLGHPQALAANPGEYEVRVGATVHNYGSEPLEAIVLRATVLQAGAYLYDESSSPFALQPGDSLFVELEPFVQDVFQGRYQLAYAVAAAAADAHDLDNFFIVPFEFGDLYTMAPVESVTGHPLSTIGLQPATPNGEYESCVPFRDANASRVAITGVDRYISVTEPLVLAGDMVATRVYEWQDGFSGLSDPGFGFAALTLVHEQFHLLEADQGQAQVQLDFDEPLLLTDGVRYLVCTATGNPEVFFGYNETVHHLANESVYDQPTGAMRNGATWFVGFTGRPTEALGVRMADAATIGMDEPPFAALSVHPNPGNGLFHLVRPGTDAVDIEVRDAAGRLVRRMATAVSRIVLDLAGEPAGVYTVSLSGARGRAVARLVVQ